MRENHFQMITPCRMDVNAGMRMATFERLLCKCISCGFYIELSLDFTVCAQGGLAVMKDR